MTQERKTRKRLKLSSTERPKQIHNLTQGKKLYEISLRQDHNKVEPVTLKLEDDDIVVNSIQNIVNEILENIGDIFVREKLFSQECKMILIALDEKINKASQNKGNKE